MLVVEGLYYPYSESKGADQFRGYREADLHLCVRICKKLFFSGRGSYAKPMFLEDSVRRVASVIEQVSLCHIRS